MKTKKIESKSFLHEYFRIPSSIVTDWCIIEEIANKEQSLRFGLWIKDTKLYLDIAHRRFYTAGSFGPIARKIHPAEKRKIKGQLTLTSRDNPDMIICLPNSFMADVFYPAIFQRSFLKDKLY